MSEAIADALGTANDALEKGDTIGATNRAYYAMFYAARLYLRTRHFADARNVKTHSGTATKFGQLAILADGMDPELGAALSRIGQVRMESDDGTDLIKPSLQNAKETLASARWFCKNVLDALDIDTRP